MTTSYGGFEENTGIQHIYITTLGLIMVLLSNIFSSLAAVHTELNLKYYMSVSLPRSVLHDRFLSVSLA